MTPSLLIDLLVLLGGLLLGGLVSFLVIRVSREKPLRRWPHCTRTGQRLAFWQLIPLVGWFAQRGRAANGQRLPWIAPVVEVLTALIVVLLYRQYGFTPPLFYLTFVCAVLIITGAIDFLYRYIYTLAILLPLLVVFVAAPLLGTVSLRASLLGAIVGGMVFILLFLLSRILFPGDAVPFGLGDVYLAIFIGAAVGLIHLAPALVYGMLLAGAVALGYLVADKLLRLPNVPRHISYGTYLCLGTIAYVLIQGLN